MVVFAPDFTSQSAPSPDVFENWVDNQLPLCTAIEDFPLSPTDSACQQLVRDLGQDAGIFPTKGILTAVRALAESRQFGPRQVLATVARVSSQRASRSWSWLFNRTSSRTAAFAGQGSVCISESLPVVKRRPTLQHAFIHASADPHDRRWVGAATS